MNEFEITTDKGFKWATCLNGTLKTAKEYFIGKYFDMGVYPIEDMQKAVKVKQL